MNTATYTTPISAGNGTAYRVILEPAEDGDGIWIAEIRALGIVTEGRGLSGAERAAANAVRGYRATAQRHAIALPAGDLQDHQ